jgi:UDP-GlcNAc:undecaprenyl-phosphate GlcNAc-1-phosphate transferase
MVGLVWADTVSGRKKMFASMAAAFLLSVFIIFALMPLAVQCGLVDAPCIRKRHTGVIPLVGGLAIYLTLVALWLAFPFWQAQDGTWLIALGLPLLLVGLVDDRWEVSASKRLLVEVVCCLAAIVYCGVRIDNLGSLLPGIGGSLVLLAVPVSLIGMVGAINAINLTDGVDGLAGGLSALTFAALAFMAYPDHLAVALQLTSIVATLVGFLVFNSRFFGRKRAAIFLGDGGAIFIGFAIVWFLIKLSQGEGAAITPVSALWLFAVPLLDTVTIMTRRILRGHSPFAADREHLHHILLLAGFGASRTVLIILASHLVCILVGIASIYLKAPDWITFVTFMAMGLTYYMSMHHAWKIMKKIKSFREWAGFECRRNEDRGANGRRLTHERRVAARANYLEQERRNNNDRRVGARR